MVWRFFVYAYFRPNEESPFYVGKGSNQRHLDHLSLHRLGKLKYNQFFNSSLSKLKQVGLGPIIKILAYFADEVSAYDYETSLIKLFGRRIDKSGILDNIDPGFRNRIGFKGKLHSAETKAKMTGVRRSEETRKLMRKPKSKEHSKNIKTARKKQNDIWVLKDPKDCIIKINNLNQYCLMNNLSSCTIYRSLKNGIPVQRGKSAGFQALERIKTQTTIFSKLEAE